ncbi:MAG: vWA domain-containing protein [Candidatus Binatia bacterium]
MSHAPPAGAASTPPERFDPWSGRRFGGIRWFAASTVFHVALLLLLATVTLTVIRKAREIRVRVIDDTMVGEENLNGAPSLRDLAGVLKMQKTVPNRAAPRGPVIRGVRAPEMPRIGGIGPKLGADPTLRHISTTLSFGAGAIGGLGGGFGDYVGGLRKVGLDVALVIDTTDSMQFVIEDVKRKLSRLVGAIQRMVPTSRVGIVVYRDRGDDYVVKWSDLSFHTKKLRAFLSHITAAGGGDWEEAVKEALDTAIHDLKWRKHSKRIIILVGGSPPHPWDADDVRTMVRAFRKRGGYISTIDVTERQHAEFDRHLWHSLHGKAPYKPSPLPDFYKEVARTFGEIARDGGGELISLDANTALVREVLQLTFGSRWKIEMAKYMKELS